MNKDRKALGRGLSALLPGSAPARIPQANQESAATPQPAATAAPDTAKSYFQAEIEDVHPTPDQPRRRFGESELDELAQSIRTYGVIQPLIVRPRKEGGYFLIAGERRWRASQRAGLHRVPVVVQDVDSKESFERALVENLQRADLNAIEEAEAYQRLVETLGHTQEEVATRVGKDRSTIANSLRLLRLPPAVRAHVEEGRLTMGHARALLTLESAERIEVAARTVISKAMSVRATEAWVKAEADGAKGKAPAAAAQPKSASVRDLESRLMKSLGAQVQVTEKKRGKGGVIEIPYADLDDLDRLLERLLS